MKLEQFNFVKKKETNMPLILLGAVIALPIAVTLFSNFLQKKMRKLMQVKMMSY